MSDPVSGEVLEASVDRPQTQLAEYKGPSGLAIGASLADLSDEEFSARLAALAKQQQRIRLIQQTVMDEGADYGTVPGTKRPTLLKGGAEKLCNLYGLVARVEVEITEGDVKQIDEPALSVEATCYLHVGTFDGPIVGIGHGNANSWEKKYRYVTLRGQVVCPDCGRAGVLMTRRHVWWHPEDAKPDGGCGANFTADDERLSSQKPKTETINDPDPYDKRNTLIKMAEKRAHVDATLRATATSALFTQDLEDKLEGEEDTGRRRERGVAGVSTNAKAGSAPWLAAMLTNEKVPPSVLKAALEAIGKPGAALTDLSDDERLSLWTTISGEEPPATEGEEGLEAADAALGYGG